MRTGVHLARGRGLGLGGFFVVLFLLLLPPFDEDDFDDLAAALSFFLSAAEGLGTGSGGGLRIVPALL